VARGRVLTPLCCALQQGPAGVDGGEGHEEDEDEDEEDEEGSDEEAAGEEEAGAQGAAGSAQQVGGVRAPLCTPARALPARAPTVTCMPDHLTAASCV